MLMYQMYRNGISAYRLAKISGVSYSQIRRIVRGQSLITLRTLGKIEDSTGWSIVEVFGPSDVVVRRSYFQSLGGDLDSAAVL